MPESIRLYLDEDIINRRLVRELRSRELDVLTANEAGLVQVPDQEHLNYATSQNRVVFTFNTRDFGALHAEYVSTACHHAGVVLTWTALEGSHSTTET